MNESIETRAASALVPIQCPTCEGAGVREMPDPAGRNREVLPITVCATCDGEGTTLPGLVPLLALQLRDAEREEALWKQERDRLNEQVAKASKRAIEARIKARLLRDKIAEQSKPTDQQFADSRRAAMRNWLR